MTTLTDRYIAETLRHLPARQHSELDAELRALVADAVDARTEQGLDAEAAERDALVELGAPSALAASYSERPRVLIGPDLFTDYVRVLRLLLSTVVPLWLLIMGITTFADGNSVLASIGAAFYGAAETAISIAFVVTLVFAVIERSPARRSRKAWDPSQLPPVVEKRGYWLELVGGVAFLLVVSAVLVGLQSASSVGPVRDELWASGVFYLALLFAVASISLHVFAWYTGFTIAHAVATTVLGVLFVVPSIWLAASGALLSPEFFGDGLQTATTVVIVVVALLSVMDSFEAWGRVLRR